MRAILLKGLLIGSTIGLLSCANSSVVPEDRNADLGGSAADQGTVGPVDGLPPPPPPAFDPANTITVDIHGWELKGAVSKGVVGDDRGGGGMADGISRYSGLPLGQGNPTAANQLCATEYYGDQLPSYYSPMDASQVMALSGIPRYALIAAKYVRHVLWRSGAKGVNLTCHSMGCEISRYLIEHDLERLVSDHLLRRWVSFSGVVNGAALAAIDSANLSKLAQALGLNLVDVQDMGYAWVQDNVAIYDHQRTNGNNPNFAGLIIHHIESTNPKVDTVLNIPLLDLFGHSNQPNDGIVLDDEQYLHGQQDAARLKIPSGTLLPVTASHHFADHFQITDIPSAQVVAAAALVGSRRVRVTLTSATMIKDQIVSVLHKTPARVAVESLVHYPYVGSIDGTDPTIDEVAMNRRNAPVLRLAQGQTMAEDLVVYSGPVFDKQQTVHVSVTLSETDYYPPGGITDDPFNQSKTLATFDQELPLTPGQYEASSANAHFTLQVAVDQLY